MRAWRVLVVRVLSVCLRSGFDVEFVGGRSI